MARYCCSRRTCLYLTITSFALFWTAIAILVYYIVFHQALPARRAHFLEIAYLRELWAADINDEILKVFAKLSDGTRSPHTQRVQPLIQDVEQLHYWSIVSSVSPLLAAFGGEWTPLYSELLGLNLDTTGMKSCAGKEYRIYLGGTAEKDEVGKKSEEHDPTVFQHRYKRSSCKDPEYICNMYNEAFDRVAQRWYWTTEGKTSKALLRFADCDVSPLLCDSPTWGLNQDAVLLLHLKIGTECEDSMGIGRCPLTWRFIGLPIEKAPWTRQIRIASDDGGSTVVPAFPSAEEQLWSLMAHAGAEDGLEYGTPFDDSPNCIITATPVEGEAPDHSVNLGINNWAGFRSVWDNPWGHEEYPKEFLIKCYVVYYMDVFLQWWDGEPEAVWPISCEGVEEERERARNMSDAWARVNDEMDEWSASWKKKVDDDDGGYGEDVDDGFEDD